MEKVVSIFLCSFKTNMPEQSNIDFHTITNMNECYHESQKGVCFS